MPGPVTGEDGVARCPWAGGPVRCATTTTPSGVCRSAARAGIFERLTLEAFQSGLSWSTILAKRPAFREVFDGFDVDRIAETTTPSAAR